MKQTLVVLFCAVFLFSSCTSFPEKQSSDDAMLIIPIVVDTSHPGSPYGNMKAVILDENDNEAGSLLLNTGADYKYILLEPGKYRISRRVFVYSGSQKQGTSNAEYISFELFPGTITVLGQYMRYSFYKRGGKNYMRGRFRPMSTTVKKMLEEQLSEEDAMTSWEIIYPERMVP